MTKKTSLDTDLRLKAAAGLEQAVAKDMEALDISMSELLNAVAEDKEEDTDTNEDQDDTEDSIWSR